MLSNKESIALFLLSNGVFVTGFHSLDIIIIFIIYFVFFIF